MTERDRQEMLAQINIKAREKSEQMRKRLYGKKYLSELIREDKPEFGSNNLILAPVGSGKSFLIEKVLIPKDFKGNVLYLTSNTALKDSIAPNSNKVRKRLAESGESIRFFTSQNRNKYGKGNYGVHVMTYAEFGERVMPPHQTFTDNIDLVFCDEIHSLPRYFTYDQNYRLGMALNWLLRSHDGKTIYYFTATRESLDELASKSSQYFNVVKTFNYLDHKDVRQYIASATYYINHLDQIRPHLRAKKKAFEYYGYKALAFTKKIVEQVKLENIAKEEGYHPIVLWSINNEDKMNDEQLAARQHILDTGHIPEPYNMLIINGAMQEGWNLYDDKVNLAILDTLDSTEQIQALGRVRRDIDLVIKKTNKKIDEQYIEVPEDYLDKDLTTGEKRVLCEDLYLIDEQGRLKKWPTIRKYIEYSGYEVKDKLSIIDGKRTRVSVISVKE